MRVVPNFNDRYCQAVKLERTEKRKSARKHAEPRRALSSKNGSIRAGGMGDLRVLVSHREGFWFARGLEIDYAAQGSTSNEVKRNFEEGLALTIGEHLKTFGNIENLIRPSPPETWRQLHKCAQGQISTSKLPHDVQAVLKFRAIRFFESEPETAVA